MFGSEVSNLTTFVQDDIIFLYSDEHPVQGLISTPDRGLQRKK